ncbi:MAG: glycosyltransferase family 2 protein [Bacteroidia bacterium]|nr:glycosyltransferase family 2 protein [Bacteroidia bacterium]
MKVAVVILNWNGKHFLETFLPSVLSNNPDYSTIYVADNNSTDDSIVFLKNNYPQIQIIQNALNGGFAKGYNDALAKLNHEYFILLNSDVEVSQNWIDGIIQLMDDDKTIAACQPKIKSFEQKSHFEYAGAAGGYIDKYGYPFCRGRIFDTLEEDKGQYDETKEVFWATGACLFIRASCFKEVNGFDEDFFAHMEEIDLCWRLKNKGYKICYSSQSTIYHVGGGTLNKTNPHKTFLNFRNNLILICKNHSAKGLLTTIFTRMVLDGIAGIKFLASGKFSHFLAIIKAHFSFYASLKTTLRKRKLLKKEIKTYTSKGIYPHSIVMDYYLRKKKTFTEIELNHPFL